MSYTLEFPIQYFPNPDRFATLGLGKLYIGVVDGNPASTPADRIQAYIARQNDTDLAITQPINLTAGGVPTYNGSPVTLKISQEYSVAVLDKNDQQIYYCPKAGEEISSINELYDLISDVQPRLTNVVAKVDDLSSITAVPGRLYDLIEYNAGTGVGGGQLLGFSGSGTPDNGIVFSGAGGTHFRRINYDKFDITLFGGLTTNTASQNDTAISRALTAVINAAGGTIYFPKGTFSISQTINATVSATTIELDNDCTIDYSAIGTAGTWDYCAVYMSGAGSRVIGGYNGGFLGSATFDGTNVAPTYASIIVNADNCYVSTRLNNVRKVGVWFKDCSDGHLDACLIEGNYPSVLWTGVETAHYGALFDPTTSPSRGNFKSTGNTIKTCVQGHLVGNYGVGQFVQGFVATGNIFESCWNHGIYSNYTSGATIVGNNFNRCQIMVVAGGPFNNVSGNTGYTDVNVVGDERDVFGISMRDAIGCICSNNALKGVNVPASAVAISWQDFGLAAEISNNICANNTIVSTAGNCIPIRWLAASVPMKRNITANNTIDTLGTPSEGAISIFGSAGQVSIGNKVSGNIINLRGSGWGVYATYQESLDVVDNTVIYEYNSGSPVAVNTVAFFTCANSKSDNNRSVVPSGFGTNLGVTGFVELTSATNNSLSNSISAVSAPATYNTFQVVANSNLNVNDSGAGAPSQTAAPGSMWRRTNGAASSTLYIKETANTSAVWRAV